MLKTILVCLDATETAHALMSTAARLARQHHAHLIGLHTLETLIAYPSIAIYVPDEAFATFQRNQSEALRRIKLVFDDQTKDEDFTSEWRVQTSERPRASARMVENAHATDLVIMAQEDLENDRSDQRHAQGQVIRDSGRPVLVVPRDHKDEEIGNTIVLGWSTTREAARAAHDLLLLAKPAATVHIVSVVKTQDQDATEGAAKELARAFNRHGLKAQVKYREPNGMNVADALNHEADEVGADLIATGAFGHSRAFDFVIGATTEALLQDANRPVLYAK